MPCVVACSGNSDDEEVSSAIEECKWSFDDGPTTNGWTDSGTSWTTQNDTAETENTNETRPMDMVEIFRGRNVTLPQVAEAIGQKLESVKGNDNIPQS